MSKEIITLRIDSEKRIALDRLAQGFDRDRSYILNQAIDYYLHINQWQIAEIEQALLEAEAEDFVSQDDVNDLFKHLTKFSTQPKNSHLKCYQAIQRDRFNEPRCVPCTFFY